MTLKELTALESEQLSTLYEQVGVVEAWQRIFREYVALAREGNLEAMKRALFLCWQNVASPGWLPNTAVLFDAELIREVYGLVNDLARNGELDSEFTWMLPYYYMIADWYLPPEFDAIVKASQQNRYLWRQGCLESSFDGRGQLGKYWASIQANLKKRHDHSRAFWPTVSQPQSRRGRHGAKRFFSIPGLRWRGRIKQFETDVYDHWASGIDRSVWARWCDRWVRSFAEEIPERSAILDVGCGTGRALRIMAAKRPSFLAGIDISPKAVAIAKERIAGLDVDLKVADVEAEMPWPDSTFDVVTMTAVIHHLPHPEELLRHVRRVLKPEGLLIVAEPHFFFPILQIVNPLLRVYPLNGDLHFLSQRGLRRLLVHCGFPTIAQKQAALLACYTVAQKCSSPEPPQG
jgi:ubiquinone/menaquinone biosynthesis C-methylase UbiE